jgi:tetratricopeptide (TPR) repeat protein
MCNTSNIKRMLFTPVLARIVRIVLVASAVFSATPALADQGAGAQSPLEAPQDLIGEVKDKNNQNLDSLNKLILKYGLVHNRSVNASLKEISERLGPYFDHPEFRIRVVILDRQKIGAFLMRGQTLVLTRGMVYSGLLESTDQVAGVLSYLLAEQLFSRLPFEKSGLTMEPGLSTTSGTPAKPILRPILYAALAMVQAGYHYQGIIDAVQLLGKSRNDPALSKMGEVLLANKNRVLKGAAYFFEGQTALFVHHNMTAIYDLSRFLQRFPLSSGGHFLLGLAYYQAFSETRHFVSERFLFLSDPVPVFRTQETPLDIGALDAAESEWDIALKLNPAYSPALNGRARILLLKGQAKDARDTFRKAYYLIDSSPWYMSDFAFSLLMGQHVVTGERLLEGALRKAPYDPKLQYDLAVWEDMKGHKERAETIFRNLSTRPGWKFLIKGAHPEVSGNARNEGATTEPAFFLIPGETMESVQKKIGFPKSPPVNVPGRTFWFYSGRGIRLVFHKNFLYYAIFEKKWDSKELGGFAVGDKYDPDDPDVPKPSWVVPYGRTPYFVFKKPFGYLAVTEKDGRISQVMVSIVPPNTTVEKDRIVRKEKTGGS